MRLDLSHYFRVFVLAQLREVVTFFDQEDIKLILHVFIPLTDYEISWVEFCHSFFEEVHPWDSVAHLTLNNTVHLRLTHISRSAGSARGLWR